MAKALGSGPASKNRVMIPSIPETTVLYPIKMYGMTKDSNKESSTLDVEFRSLSMLPVSISLIESRIARNVYTHPAISSFFIIQAEKEQLVNPLLTVRNISFNRTFGQRPALAGLCPSESVKARLKQKP